MGGNCISSDDQDPIQALHEEGYDILLYKGDISYKGFELVVHGAPSERRDKVLLVLVTLGGDIDAGYRIAQYLRETYKEEVTVLVPGMCKSAGTLICVGSRELVIGESGELGPLDIQVREKGELFSFNSGLAIPQALDYLDVAIRNTLRETIVNFSAGRGLGTERAAEIAIRTAIGVFEPIYRQINPERLGEVARLLAVAEDYADRLQGNLKQGSLGILLSGYSSHSYAIDRSEAERLFESVRKPNRLENALAHYLGVDFISAVFRASQTEVRYIEVDPAHGDMGGQQSGIHRVGQTDPRGGLERRDPEGPEGTVGTDEGSGSGVAQGPADARIDTPRASAERVNVRRTDATKQAPPRDAESG